MQMRKSLTPRHRLLLLYLLLMSLTAFGLLSSPGHSEQAGTTLTMMIYMCGSDLESLHGCGSADIEEMIQSGIQGQDVRLLVMTGGSKRSSAGYFSPEATGIYEIARGRQRRIWASDTAMNMGDADTLTFFLQRGMESKPADNYALILWDHGEGPLDGVCIDENFQNDRLSMDELKEGLTNANLPRKLKLIGFDACLMSDLEVAEAMAPFAECMIASQETENAQGWDYSFLREVSADQSGTEIGRLAVDCFHSSQKNPEELYTLSCVDLSGLQKVSEELNAFFSRSPEMDETLFSRMSSLRLDTTTFGWSPDEGSAHDLVDLYDLAENMEEMIGDASALKNALDEAITYHKSNIQGAHGLSVYYPFMNKPKYRLEWRKGYHQLRNEGAYLRHLEVFGSFLTDGGTVPWNHLHAAETAVDGNGNHFALQLSSEQSEQFLFGQLLILEQGSIVSGEETNYSLVASVPAQMDGNGLVTCTYSGRTLYIQREDGKLTGPISYTIRPDSDRNLLIAMFAKEGENLLDSTRVSFELERESAEDGSVPFQVKVLDEVTGTYTNRIAFHEEEYANLTVQDIFRTSPGLAPEKVQPGFSEWKAGQNERSGVVIPLPDQWRFVYLDQMMAGSRYCAVFQITDVHLNNYTSDAVPMTNRVQTEIHMDPAEISTEEYDLSVSLRKDTSVLESGLRLQVELHNQTEESGQFWLNHLIINGTRIIGEDYLFYLDPGQYEIADILIPAMELAGLEKLDTLSFTVSSRQQNKPRSPSGERAFLLSAQEECRLDDFLLTDTVTGSGGTKDCPISVLKIEPSMDGKGLTLSALAENRTDMPLSLRGSILINDRLQLDLSGADEIPAGCSRLIRCNIKNCLSELFGTNIRLSEQDGRLTNYIIEDNLIQRMNQNPVRTLTFLPGFGGRGTEPGNPIPVWLDEPFEVNMISSPLFTSVRLSGDQFHLTPLAECETFQADAAGIGWGTDGLVLVLRLENKTEEPITVGMTDFLLNSRALELDPGSAESYLLAPKSEMLCDLILKKKEDLSYPESAQAEIGLDFYAGDPSIRKSAVLRLRVDSEEGPYYTGNQIIIPDADQSGSE